MIDSDSAVSGDIGNKRSKTSTDPSRPDLLSVIVRTMPGRERFLSECLSGIARQTYRPLEVIVTVQHRHPDDDLDPIQAIVAQVRPEIEALTLLSHESPGDARSKSLNMGVSAASGRYLALCDDDDYVHPSHYTELISAVNKDGTAWAYSDTERVLYDVNGRVARRTLHYRRTRYSFARLIGSNFIPSCSFVVDRAKIHEIPPFDETRSVLEDYEFLLRLGYRHTPSYVRSATCEYRLRLDGTNTAPIGDSERRLEWCRAEIGFSSLKRALLRDWAQDASRGRRPLAGLIAGTAWYGFRLIKCYLMFGVLRILFSKQSLLPRSMGDSS
ncbi:MAG: glycosyltransferase family 2 protein [Acidiferrobacteraceae bacterium]